MLQKGEEGSGEQTSQLAQIQNPFAWVLYGNRPELSSQVSPNFRVGHRLTLDRRGRGA